jgi:hypothetical protein
MTGKIDDPRKYNPRYQYESNRYLVSTKSINPIGAKQALAMKKVATILEDEESCGRPVPFEKLQSDWKRFNFIIIDGTSVDFDSFGALTHISTSNNVVLLRFTA